MEKTARRRPRWLSFVSLGLIRLSIFAFSLLFTLAGCVIYLDNPPLRYISGRVLRADNGAPIAGARVHFYSGRKPFSLLPVDTFGIDASTTTDAEGRFSVSAKLNAQVSAIAQDDELIGQFPVPPFPASNRVENLTWKLSKKKPPLPHARRKA